ncbi:MAG TPA: hypothetical protein VK920_02650 [Solirubrobacterales bacterium]|nr:hypothetical protein [Solirubrobacterales bacterium]
MSCSQAGGGREGVHDRISAAKAWWGYSVYFPHDPLVNTVVTLVASREIAQLTALISAAMNAVDLGWVVSALRRPRSAAAWRLAGAA